jgi:hypothetical protein
MDVSAIATANIPILFIDTCSLLDIMRDPTRDNLKVNEREAAIQLLKIAETGGVHLALAEQVSLEFAEHDLPIQEEAERNLGKLRDKIERINKLSSVLGAPGTIDLSHLDDHVPMTRKIVDRWIQKSQIIRTPTDAPMKAFARVNASRAPAVRGKDSSKDCLIFETYLFAAEQIRSAGISEPIVFLSSNTKEYYTNGSNLKPDIMQDFAPSRIDYAPNMAAAKFSLGL